MPTAEDTFEITWTSVRADGAHKRCTECEEIVLECYKNFIIVVDLDYLNELKTDTPEDDPMHKVYQSINPDALPATICPGCEPQIDFTQIF